MNLKVAVYSYQVACSANYQCNSAAGLTCPTSAGQCNCPTTSTAYHCDCATGYYWNYNTLTCGESFNRKACIVF